MDRNWPLDQTLWKSYIITTILLDMLNLITNEVYANMNFVGLILWTFLHLIFLDFNFMIYKEFFFSIIFIYIF